MKVLINSVDGETLSLDVTPKMTVGQLKVIDYFDKQCLLINTIPLDQDR